MSKETLIEHLQSAFDSEMFQTEEGDALIRLEDAICYVEEFAPPKREPLSTDTMLRLITEHRDFPLNLVRAIEKAHGIGGGE